MIEYKPSHFRKDVEVLANKIAPHTILTSGGGLRNIFGVPRGGLPVAIALSNLLGLELVDDPWLDGVLVVDDLVDSGSTMKRYPGKPFAALHVKPHSPRPDFFAMEIPNEWIRYFWEGEGTPKTVEENIVRCLQFIGEDPTREGLLETPGRITKAWGEMFCGYKKDPQEVFKTFDGSQVGGLVYLKGIEFYSCCEHHMLPFFGEAMVAYIPDGRIIGASKMARLLDVFARRMQVQERIGEQVTEALMTYLKPKGAACLTEAKHLCISCRGVQKQQSVLGYSSLKGVFLEHTNAGIAARAELMSLWNR